MQKLKRGGEQVESKFGSLQARLITEQREIGIDGCINRDNSRREFTLSNPRGESAKKVHARRQKVMVKKKKKKKEKTSAKFASTSIVNPLIAAIFSTNILLESNHNIR